MASVACCKYFELIICTLPIVESAIKDAKLNELKLSNGSFRFLIRKRIPRNSSQYMSGNMFVLQQTPCLSCTLRSRLSHVQRNLRFSLLVCYTSYSKLLVRAGPLRARKMFLRVLCKWVYCTTKFRRTMSTPSSMDVSALTAFFRIAIHGTKSLVIWYRGYQITVTPHAFSTPGEAWLYVHKYCVKS